MLTSRAALGCAAIVAVSSLAACFADDRVVYVPGAGGAGATSASPGGAGGLGGAGPFAPGPHGAAPQVVTVGGTVLTAPKLQVIAYAKDPFASEVDKFIVELTRTPSWSEQTIEYGVGQLTVLPTILLPGDAPKVLDDDSDGSPFEADLAAKLSGPSPAYGPADPSTMYLFLLPMGTDIKSGGSCCTDFLGYHWETPAGGTTVPYGIVCDCAPLPDDVLTPLQWVTTTVIHEMVEMATDPFPGSSEAFGENDPDHLIWAIVTGGELSDMCEYNDDSNYAPPGATYMIQRSWSNAAARAGKNPCVPAAGTAPYFNSVPVLEGSVVVDYYGTPAATKGVTIPVGASKTIDVQLFSEAPTAGPWTVTVYDLSAYLGGKPHLDLTLDKASGSNGDTLKLTIKVLSVDTLLHGEGFVLASDLDGQSNLSMGVVGN